MLTSRFFPHPSLLALHRFIGVRRFMIFQGPEAGPVEPPTTAETDKSDWPVLSLARTACWNPTKRMTERSRHIVEVKDFVVAGFKDF